MKGKALLVVMALGASLAIGLFAIGCGGGDDKSDAPAKSTPAAVSDDTSNTPKPPKSDPDTHAFQEIAVEACMDSALESGVPEDMAQEYCDCAMDELLKNVDADELAEIGVNALSGDEDLPTDIEDKLMDAVLECLDMLME